MKKILSIRYVLRVVAVLAVLPLLSCHQRDLTDTFAAVVEVEFDWRNAPGANPEEMRVYLFPVDGGAYQVYGFGNCTGGTIKAREGTYKAVCVNSDTENILYTGLGSYDNFKAYVMDGEMRSTTSRLESTKDERLAPAPDALYSAYLEEEVTLVMGTNNKKITFYPKLTQCHYTVTITNVTNLKYVTSGGLFGTLSGLSGGYMLGSGQAATDPTLTSFDPQSDGSSTITAEFLSFGNAGTALHELVIYFEISDGTRVYFPFDVSDQVNNAEDPYNVHITLDGLVLPKPITNGSGFRPEVDDWDDEIWIDINMV